MGEANLSVTMLIILKCYEEVSEMCFAGVYVDKGIVSQFSFSYFIPFFLRKDSGRTVDGTYGPDLYPSVAGIEDSLISNHFIALL